MRIKSAVSFLIFALIVAFTYSFFVSIGVTFRPPPDRTRISMQIPDIDGLVVGSSVQLRGVPIGEVSRITTTVAGATVDFFIDGRYRIPVDSDVRLENLSALGEAYIGLVPRSDHGPNLHDGQRIAAEAVTLPPSISELATSVARVLNQFDPDALKRIIDEGDAALPNPTEVLPNLSRASTLLRNTAANMNGHGAVLLENFQALLHNADFVGPVLAFNTPWLTKIGKDFANALNLPTSIIARRGAPQTIHNLANLVSRIGHLLDHSSGDIKVLMQTMLPYLNDISGALMNLDTGQLLSNMVAAVPEDGAVTLHVTVPGADEPVGAPPGPADAPPVEAQHLPAAAEPAAPGPASVPPSGDPAIPAAGPSPGN
jgi:virulence factor Mce-like protein